MTDSDYEKCRDAFSSVMDWTSLMRLTITMRSCLPLKFFICTQYVNTLPFLGLNFAFYTMAMCLTTSLCQTLWPNPSLPCVQAVIRVANKLSGPYPI